MSTLADARINLTSQGRSKEGLGGLIHSDEQVFREWHAMEMSELARPINWTTPLPRCPQRLERCTGPNWNEPKTANSLHPGGVWEVRSIDFNFSSNQCIYDANGDIMPEIPAAGSADFHSCWVVGTCGFHWKHDVRPYDFAIRLDKQAFEDTGVKSEKFISLYYEARPRLIEGMNF